MLSDALVYFFAPNRSHVRSLEEILYVQTLHHEVVLAQLFREVFCAQRHLPLGDARLQILVRQPQLGVAPEQYEQPRFEVAEEHSFLDGAAEYHLL